jgi:hypothetical protein
MLALAVLYLATGAWPLVPVFGDGMAIANGAEEIKRSGLGPNPLTYLYSQHPGAHALPAAVSAATGLDTMRSLLLLVFLASVVSAVCVSALTARLLSISWPVALVAVLLFQETWVSGYYGNSTVLASAFAFAALLLLAGNRGPGTDVAAGLAFAAAGVMRLDAVLTVPAAIGMILIAGRSEALRRIAIVGAVAGSALALSLYLLGFDPDEVSASLAFKEALFDAGGDLENTVRSLAAFFSVLCLLLMASGCLALWRDGRKDLLWLVLLGMLPTAFLYASGLDTPRYLFYTLPFATLLVARGLSAAWPAGGLKGYVWLAVLLAAFAGQYLISYGKLPADAIRSPFVFSAAPSAEPDGRVHAVIVPPAFRPQPVIGVGNNGGRLGTGLVMAPRWYSNNKRRVGNRVNDVRSALHRAGNEGHPVISLGWGSAQLGLQTLLYQGYVLAHSERDAEWRWDRYEFISPGARVDFIQYRFPIINKGRDEGIQAILGNPTPGTVVLLKPSVARDMGIESGDEWMTVGDGVYVRAR